MLSTGRARWVRRGVVLAVAALAALGVWRSPSAALVRLKIALDRHDLAAVERIVDLRALTDAALARLVEERPGEVEHVRLALRGRGGWLPAITSARDYLRVRLGRAVERLVEDQDGGLHVSWSDLQTTLGTLERSGATASFVFRDAAGGDYGVRMRRTTSGWRIVSVERDGEQAVLRPLTPAAPPAENPPTTASTAPDPSPAAAGRSHAAPSHAANEPAHADASRVAADPGAVDGGPPREEQFAMLLDEAATLARKAATPRRHARRPGDHPFARRLDGGTWTVQVASTTDPLDADVQREWFSERGEAAFVMPADVRGQTWQRVMVGRYPTLAEAERTAARLGEPPATSR